MIRMWKKMKSKVYAIINDLRNQIKKVLASETSQKIVTKMRITLSGKRTRKPSFLVALSLALMIFVLSQGLVADPSVGPDNGPATVNPLIRSVQWPAYEGVKPETFSITKDTSQLFRFDREITRTATSNANIIDLTTIGDKDILVNAKTAGAANLLVWDKANQVAAYKIDSTLNLDKLAAVLANIDPKAELMHLPFNDTVAIYGTAETSLKLEQIEQAALAFDKKALSFVRLKNPKQILLEVRFAEVNRKKNKDFKLDAELINTYFTTRHFIGDTGASAGDDASAFTPAGSPIAFTPIGSPDETTVDSFGQFVNDKWLVSGFMQWLEQKNVLKIIARPNMMAKDGEEASFVVGGEFPVPVSTNDRINIEYKEFGTKLKFTPEILDNEVIRLTVETEVSELDFSTTVSFGGVVVPSIIKRTHKTVAELRDNQSFVIAGLLTQKVDQVKKKMPILGSIPILGYFFRSDAFSRSDVELMVVITPHLVEPFEFGEDKEMYPPDQVSQAVQAFAPLYADSHGDAIHSLITQKEMVLPVGEDKLKAY